MAKVAPRHRRVTQKDRIRAAGNDVSDALERVRSIRRKLQAGSNPVEVASDLQVAEAELLRAKDTCMRCR